MATCPVCGWWDRVCKCTKGTPSVHVWKPRYFEHLDATPIYIESKKQLKAECAKRGLKAVCLM